MRSYQLVKKSELNIARESIYNRDCNTCQICEVRFNDNPEIKKNIDHIIPRSAIAWSHPFNLQLLCESCNAEKGSDIPDDFWDIILNNSRKSAKWFIDQSPTNYSKEERMNFEVFKAIFDYPYFDFDFTYTYEVFSLYYDDEYINSMIGFNLDDPELDIKLPEVTWGIFIIEIENIKKNMDNQLRKKLAERPSLSDIEGMRQHHFSFKQEAKKHASWLKALGCKLEVIHEAYLANIYKKAAYQLEDSFKSGISF